MQHKKQPLRKAALACAALTALVTSSSLAAQRGVAVYELTFVSTWSKTTHPVSFPSFPHYSPLIGATHNASHSFWKPGGIATAGIESMAETGSTSPLSSEIQAAINAKTAKSMIRGSGLGSPAKITIRFTAHASHPHLTMVTMLAPSPDWFVGLAGVPLIKNGAWVDRMSFAATLWDAGTDSGVSYTSPNKNTSPKQKIAVISTSAGPFKGYSTTVGTWSIKRVASTHVYGCGANPRGSMTTTGEARLGQTVTFSVHDPGASMAKGSRAFLLVSATATPNSPCGVRVPGFGMSKPGAPGEFLLGAVLATLPGNTWSGTPVPFRLAIPTNSTLIGVDAFVQGGLVTTTRLGLADATAVRIGR